MKRAILSLVFVLSTISCQAQKADLKLDWKDFVSSEAGIKVSLPCEPKKRFKSFQDEPRQIHTYDFDCEAKGMKFLVSFKNHLDNFDENTIQKTFEANESNLKVMFGKVDKFLHKEDFQTNGFTSRFYEVYPSSGGKVVSLIVVNEKGTYEAMFGLKSENETKLKALKVDFDGIAKKFIDSFEVAEKK